MSLAGCGKTKVARQATAKISSGSEDLQLHTLSLCQSPSDPLQFCSPAENLHTPDDELPTLDREELTELSKNLDTDREALEKYREELIELSKNLDNYSDKLTHDREALTERGQNLDKYHKQIDDKAKSMFTFSNNVNSYVETLTSQQNINISDLPPFPDRPDLLIPQPPNLKT
jgi:DNA repair exonuclease SbcCD ATPase subunit